MYAWDIDCLYSRMILGVAESRAMAKQNIPRVGCALSGTSKRWPKPTDFGRQQRAARGGWGCLKPELLEGVSRMSRTCRSHVSLLAP